MEYKDKYTKYKIKYNKLKNEQIGGNKKNFNENSFINKSLFYTHFTKENRKED